MEGAAINDPTMIAAETLAGDVAVFTNNVLQNSGFLGIDGTGL